MKDWSITIREFDDERMLHMEHVNFSMTGGSREDVRNTIDLVIGDIIKDWPSFKTSQHRGVSWSNEAKKWRAMIGWNGKKIHLGYFDKESDAAEAYLSAQFLKEKVEG